MTEYSQGLVPESLLVRWQRDCTASRGCGGGGGW